MTLFLRRMASKTLKGIPAELHGQSKNQAALATRRDQKWIDEAIASGPETPLTEKNARHP